MTTIHRLLLLLGCALAACGDDPTTPPPIIDAAGPRQVVSDTRSLLVGELAEGVLHGGPADRATIHLAAPTANLDWNLHGHAGGSTQTVAEGLQQIVVDYDFTPSGTGDWFLLVRNHGTTPLTVTYELGLYGDMQWQGWQ